MEGPHQAAESSTRARPFHHLASVFDGHFGGSDSCVVTLVDSSIFIFATVQRRLHGARVFGFHVVLLIVHHTEDSESVSVRCKAASLTNREVV